MKALVAGAGVGGLTTAIALRARGIDVEVFEAAPEARTSGGGLGIACNATKVLAALGIDLPSAGVGRVCERFTLHTARGRLMRELPISSIAAELGSPVVNVRRADLVTLLRDEAGDTPIHHGAEVVGYERAGGGVSVVCADGRTATGDLLVGADGIRSAVRARVVGPEPVNEYGYVCWIATTAFEHPALPPGGAAHYWGRGQRFGLIDIGGGDVYWWGTKNFPVGQARRWAGTKDDVRRYYAGWASEVGEVIARTPETGIVSVPAQDRDFTDRWGDGPVTLVGDAAHPMLTSLSQGAGSAIEDGYALAHHLAHANGHPDGVVAGLRRYEHARRERTRWLVSASRRLSRTEQLAHPVAVGLRDLVIRYAPASAVRKQNLAPMRAELPAEPEPPTRYPSADKEITR
ncbi:FAD-dependent monooxygenase [Actinophytocola algeriensis]|uniref:2-polyprenyl-6-methoxyphenol hydroxylase-like FAD-dependent oxidoreductase n=1 Tax=Actinophytocola algeriensis TaxID=1768010 RepID=A0A7W7QDP9_9PSEU|nr:FAD-dependent monooxygenase [Actinophytocola algeriensis]MBB4911628.1 2-polyprenyl-6-methoxyphenol hydroxylase-like FAD-dependent oxidoreductase [Actinophytocola algeriensis]MBE1473384.1 2-polyprenyl-6-methoxyphenol hydroxylase-like FAD-dependent oxidoreductase [Actinophytocola algeriensis]